MCTRHVVASWYTSDLYAVTTDFHWVAAEYTLWQNCNAEFDNLIASLEFHILEFILVILYNINTYFTVQTLPFIFPHLKLNVPITKPRNGQ